MSEMSEGTCLPLALPTVEMNFSIEPLLEFLETRIRVPYLEGTIVDRYVALPLKDWYVRSRQKKK